MLKLNIVRRMNLSANSCCGCLSELHSRRSDYLYPSLIHLPTGVQAVLMYTCGDVIDPTGTSLTLVCNNQGGGNFC